jgi:polysaccharide export outer membrane protein
MRVIESLAFFCFCIIVGILSVAAQEPNTVKQGSETAGISPSTKPGTQIPPSANSPDERYRIGYRDTLDVQVFRHSDLNKRVSVNDDGTITLFRLDKPIVAVCKTELELAGDIAKAYEKDYLRDPEVNVVAVEQKSQSVSVIGAVEKPGSFFINRRVQLLELLAFAGGPRTSEAGTRLLVARTGSSSNCQQDIATAKSDDNVQLMDFKIRDVQTGKQTLWMQPGDVVSVLDSDVVYMYGNVNKQGAVKIKEPLTLTQAIVLAEGLKGSTQKDRVRVLRQKPGAADREEMVYDLTQINRGKAKDPFLEPNDIVAISEDKAKSIVNNIARSITGGLPSVFYRIPL